MYNYSACRVQTDGHLLLLEDVEQEGVVLVSVRNLLNVPGKCKLKLVSNHDVNF